MDGGLFPKVLIHKEPSGISACLQLHRSNLLQDINGAPGREAFLNRFKGKCC